MPWERWWATLYEKLEPRWQVLLGVFGDVFGPARCPLATAQILKGCPSSRCVGDDGWMDDDTASESRHISAWINRSAMDVYRYASDPARLPEWAAGLAEGELTRVGDTWVAQSPMGQITIEFTPANDLGVLDHVITMPSGEPVFNPLRVVPAGDDWSEVVFTLRRRPGMSGAEFDANAARVAADLKTLKRVLEDRPRG